MPEPLALASIGAMGIPTVEAPVDVAVLCIAIVFSSCTSFAFDDSHLVRRELPIVAILRLWMQKRRVLLVASRDFAVAVLWAGLQGVTRMEAIFTETTFTHKGKSLHKLFLEFTTASQAVVTLAQVA